MTKRLVILVLLHLLPEGRSQSISPAVQLSEGLVRGKVITSAPNNSVQFYAFQGIPFAEPPIGKLRFQAPVRKKPWKGVLDAVKDGPKCLQLGLFDLTEGKEDCLYLNVYSLRIPSLDKKKELKPVMFWIYGGSFSYGSGGYDEAYRPEYLMEKDVVVVTFNYRLGVFGFLSTMDQAAWGNAGLKDMVAALTWVRENIKHFGGDPNNVTIFGESAGGAAVQYLLISPQAKGLFHKAISQSGSCLGEYAFQTDPWNRTRKLAKSLRLKWNSTDNLVSQLQKLRPSVLLTSSKPDPKERTNLFATFFLPTVETNHSEAFITKTCYKSLSEGNFANVPYMTGFNTAEGLIYLGYLAQGYTNILDYVLHPKLLIPKTMNLHNETVIDKVAEKIRTHFFGAGYIFNVFEFVDFISDTYFFRQAVRSVDLLRKYIPVYSYQFSFKGSLTAPFPGVSHGEELQFIWYSGILDLFSSKQTVKRMATMWTNFACKGNPTPDIDPLLSNTKWPRMPADGNMLFMDIDQNLEVRKNIKGKNYKFWKQLFELYAEPPFEGW